MRNGRLIDAGYFTIAILAESPELVNINMRRRKKPMGSGLRHFLQAGIGSDIIKNHDIDRIVKKMKDNTVCIAIYCEKSGINPAFHRN
ncbi:hypothetical protein J43TS9_34360 [Paenibacillus cineris]|nr:hypothetical protein J43TS9_34360 [Paenibacillus cineris]